MKFLFVALFVAIAVAQADYYDDDIFGLPRATQIFGEIDAGELNDWNKIIGTESVDVDGKEDKVVEKMIVFPKPGSTKHVHIEAIAHFDGLLDPSIATIMDGGVGHDHVTLKVQSKPGQRIESFIRFYGKYV